MCRFIYLRYKRFYICWLILIYGFSLDDVTTEIKEIIQPLQDHTGREATWNTQFLGVTEENPVTVYPKHFVA